MNVASILAELRTRLSEVRPRLAELSARHRFWLEAAGITVLALAFLFLVGSFALRRSVGWETQAEALRDLETRMLGVARTFQPADSVEAVYWQESREVLSGLALLAPDPLTVAGLVAQRAEEIGINSLRFRLDEDSSSNPIGPIRSGEWSAEPQPKVIVADFAGSPSVVARFVGVLPPHVEVGALRVDTIGGSPRNELRLVVRSLQGPG